MNIWNGLARCGLSALVLHASAAAAHDWTSSWGAALMPTSAKTTLAPDRAQATLRQLMRLSLGGSALRVRISNRWGSEPLVIGAASVARAARAGASGLDGDALPLRFKGQAGATVAPGADIVSDALPLASTGGELLAVSLQLDTLPAQQSVHIAAHATQFLAPGSQAMLPTLEGAQALESWYQVEGIEVLPAQPAPLLVAIGDSITDGTGSGLDRDERWPDFLQRRLRETGAAPLAVVDAGIGGNRMLADGNGPRLLSRFEHDVLERPGVTHALVLIGVNDLGVLHRGKHDTPEARAGMLAALEDGWRALAAQARARGVCLLAGTITPYGASRIYDPTPENEADRQQLNTWLRTSDLFDGVADFDAAVRDPAAPDHLQAAYDSGDHLHLSPAGYRAMAGAVPLERLATCRWRAQATAAKASGTVP